MTKSWESGENEITEQARREAARAKQDLCDILAAMLVEARAARNTDLVQKIIQAQKYLGCRNKRKRSSNQ
jgi:hypothetical protein